EQRRAAADDLGVEEALAVPALVLEDEAARGGGLLEPRVGAGRRGRAGRADRSRRGARSLVAARGEEQRGAGERVSERALHRGVPSRPARSSSSRTSPARPSPLAPFTSVMASSV